MLEQTKIKREAWAVRGLAEYQRFSVGTVKSADPDICDKVFIEDDDFTYDARLYLNGDFGSLEATLKYAQSICNMLNKVENEV